VIVWPWNQRVELLGQKVGSEWELSEPKSPRGDLLLTLESNPNLEHQGGVMVKGTQRGGTPGRTSEVRDGT